MKSFSERTRWKAAGASGVLAALGVTAVAFGAASGGATAPQTDRAELQTTSIQNYGSGGNGSGTGPVIRYCFDEHPILNAAGNQANFQLSGYDTVAGGRPDVVGDCVVTAPTPNEGCVDATFPNDVDASLYTNAEHIDPNN